LSAGSIGSLKIFQHFFQIRVIRVRHNAVEYCLNGAFEITLRRAEPCNHHPGIDPLWIHPNGFGEGTVRNAKVSEGESCSGNRDLNFRKVRLGYQGCPLLA